MISVLIALSAAIGSIIALLRGRVYLVMGASIIFALVIAGCGAALGHPLGISMLTGFGAVVAVQASYVALGLALELFAAENFIRKFNMRSGASYGANLSLPMICLRR
jgi:hypothetical protein